MDSFFKITTHMLVRMIFLVRRERIRENENNN